MKMNITTLQYLQNFSDLTKNNLYEKFGISKVPRITKCIPRTFNGLAIT